MGRAEGCQRLSQACFEFGDNRKPDRVGAKRGGCPESGGGMENRQKKGVLPQGLADASPRRG